MSRPGGRPAVLLLLAVLLAPAQVSLARFTDAGTARAGFGTATLRPPTGLTATGGTGASLAWTPSTSTWASGYEVLRSAVSGSGYALVGTVSPVTASVTADSAPGGTWFYVLRTTFRAWTSVASNEASVLIGSGSVTSALADCTTTAAETSGAGDNNGYEGTPARGCVEDGAVATDADSGTGGGNSCTSATRDRHRFGGYALGLPASVTSIDGITVRAVAGMSNNGGTSWMCVQLSPDGGATWTAARSVTMAAAALHAYTFGAPSDTWGRAWTPAELAPGALRVRVVDSSSQPNKTFRLDAVQVSVRYTP